MEKPKQAGAKFEGTFVAWMGIIDREEGLMGYQFLFPGVKSDMPSARVAGTLTATTPEGGMYAFRPEPWVDDEMKQSIARNWAKFNEKIRDFNKGIRGEN